MNYENLYGWFPQETVPFYTLRDKNETLVVMKVPYDEDFDFIYACLKFAAWLRQEYEFPIRVPIYFKSKAYLKCVDGDIAYGTCFIPDTYKDEPYIRIATGDYVVLCKEWGEKYATLSILRTLAHELTHYYQWINGVSLSHESEERQAVNTSKLIIEYYLGFINNDY